MASTEMAEIPPQAKRVAVAVIAGLIAPILDTTIVTIALDRLAESLHATVDTVQWTATAYLLALAVAVPLVGWAARRFGSRAAWRAGLALFLIGSVLCAAAWSIGALIAFRVVQGLGAGLLFPLMTSILVSAGGGAALGRLVAMVTLPTALGPILGPVVGGLILHELDWPWLFLVNVPVCLVALWLSRRIPDDRAPGEDRPALDVVGVALLAPGLIGLLLGLSNSHLGLGRADVLLPAGAGAALLGAFTVRALRGGRTALVDLRVLARRPVFASSIGLFFFSAATFGALFALPLYLQQIRGEAVLGTALLLIPQGVGALLSRSLAGRLTDAFGARWVAVAGFALVAGTTVPFALAQPGGGTVGLLAALFGRGLGLGTLLSPVMAAAFVGLPGERRHDAGIVTRTAQQLGGSVGTAVIAVVLAAGGGGEAGFREAFWWLTAVTVVGGVLALLLPTGAPGEGGRSAPFRRGVRPAQVPGADGCAGATR